MNFKILLIQSTLAVFACGLDIGTESFVTGSAGRIQTKAQAAYGGGVFLSVWTENNDGRLWIAGSRIDTAGHSMDTAGIVISTGAQNRLDPSVSFCNGQFFAVWTDMRNSRDYDVYGARISLDGSVLDTAGILIAGGLDNQMRPHLTDIPGGFMVVYQQWVGQGYVPCFIRINVDGNPLDVSPTRLVNAEALAQPVENYLWNAGFGSTAVCERPRIAGIDTTLLIVWTGHVARSAFGWYYACCALVSSSGNILKPPRYFYFTGQRCFVPDIVKQGNRFLGTWENPSERGSGAQHSAIYLDSAGNNTPDTVVLAGRMALEPALAGMSDASYMLHRQAVFVGGAIKRLQNQVVLRRIISGTRNPVDSTLLSSWGASPALATDNNGRMLILYSRLPDSTNYDVPLSFRMARESGGTKVEVNGSSGASLSLSSAPNPFTGGTMLHYVLPRNTRKVKMAVVGINGKVIREFKAESAAGPHQVRWNGFDQEGRIVSPGLYFLLLEADGKTLVRSMASLK